MAVLPLLVPAPIWLLVASLAAVGALIGSSLRALGNWLVRRVRDRAGGGWPPFRAITGLLAATALLDRLISRSGL